MRRHALLAAALTASILALPAVAQAAATGVSCDYNAGTAAAQPSNAGVIVIGDSLTFGEWCLTGSKPTAGHRYAELRIAARVEARIGKFASGGSGANPGGLDILTREVVRAKPTTRILFSLGTNDLASGRSAVSYRSTIERAVALAAGRDIYFVTLNVKRLPKVSATYNQQLLDAAKGRPNVHIIDWSQLLAANPDWTTSDGVHLTGTGYARRANYTSSRVASCVAQPSYAANGISVCQ